MIARLVPRVFANEALLSSTSLYLGYSETVLSRALITYLFPVL